MDGKAKGQDSEFFKVSKVLKHITLGLKTRLLSPSFVFYLYLSLFFFSFFSFIYLFIYFTVLYWFCHTLIWIHHGCTCVPHPEPPSHVPPHPIPLGHPSAPAPSTLSHALNLDWWFVSHRIMYMFQCHSPISSNPRPLPQSPKTVLCICVSFAVSHTELSLPSF